MEYTCMMTIGNQKQHWPAEIRILGHTGQVYEAEVKGRGSHFHLLTGRHSYGHFICIPNVSVGCEMAGCDNIGWNMEKLSFLLPEVDAVTLAYGLYHLEEADAEYQDWNNI